MKIQKNLSHLTKNQIWNQILFVIENFHLTYKQILWVQTKFILETDSDTDFDNVRTIVQANWDDIINDEFQSKYLGCYNEITSESIFEKNKDVIIMQVLNFKNPKDVSYQLILMNNLKSTIKFNIITDTISSDLSVTISDDKCVEFEINQATPWMNQNFCSKFFKLLTTVSECDSYVKSLSLIPIDKYRMLYHQLKEKYSKQLIKNWTENTDPLKYVHEDISITAYLIIFWNELKVNPRFVDLGCGNGLLVYLLTQEGFNGYGIDVRKRKIWDTYPKRTILKIHTIEPSRQLKYDNVDWIIGNHSDELTPWIPIISAQSSRKCNFFIIPCCCYDFNGNKYQRTNTKISQYAEYLQYIKDIAQKCGFIDLQFDKLRIPSTKRVCLIGRNCIDFDEQNIDNVLDGKFTDEIRLRPVHEAVKNCTQINRNVADQIVLKVFNYLLSLEESHKEWNSGGVSKFQSLINLLNLEEKGELVRENGGLKTLLKNYHQIFVVEKDVVRIRVPMKSIQKNQHFKTKPCWFYFYHPNKCLLSNDDCSYLH